MKRRRGKSSVKAREKDAQEEEGKKRMYSFVRLVMTRIPSTVRLCVFFSSAVTYRNTQAR